MIANRTRGQFSPARIVTAASEDAVVFPHCSGRFIQLVDPSDFTPEIPRRRNDTTFNPLIVLHNNSDSDQSPPSEGRRSYDLYYDNGSGTGIRPLPSAMSESLLGSGFEVMLDRLSQIGFSLWARPENPPASKHAVASLPASSDAVVTIRAGEN